MTSSIHSIMYRQSCKPFLATNQSESIQSKQDSIHSIKMIPNSVSSNTTTYSFQQGLQQQQLYGVSNPMSLESSSSGWQVPNDHHSASLLYNLSILKDKFHQVQSLVNMFVIDSRAPESTSAALASMTTFVQEIIVSASSMLFTCQQMAIGNDNNKCTTQLAQEGLYEAATAGNGGLDWYGHESYSTNNTNCEAKDQYLQQLPQNCDIVELNAADLLAKYTHYCQVCGKGFKRDANLRMHMRAHGDEYKSAAALTSPFKMKANTINNETSNTLECSMLRKYSCPQEGCRWNKKHAKFQPLKSMICAKNHYKRSHCPKMYVCKRCSRKQFSVLSDLRTHEKHCGDLKWQCSCGTTFSRKDKLMGHVGLFVGHKPIISNVGADRNKVKRSASSSYTNN